MDPVKPDPATTDPAPATPQPAAAAERPVIATGPDAAAGAPVGAVGSDADGPPVAGRGSDVTAAEPPAAAMRSDAAAAEPAVPSPVAVAEPGADGDKTPAAEGEQLGQRAERSPRDMAMSLAVLLVPIALVLIFYRVVLSGDAPVTVDTAATIQEAQAAKLFTIAVPKPGDDWHASSATWQKTAAGGTLRIGYVDPDKDPIQLIESNVDSQTLARTELTSAAAQTGRYQAGDRTWRLYTGRPGEQALVLFDPDRTIIIVGRTKAENLETLASALS